MAKIERPNIVEPKNMIYVAMRYQNRIEMADLRTQGLLAKIYRGIDKDLFIAMLDQNRNPEPLVARIVGKARLTVAPDRGNAGGSACAEESKFH